MKYLILGLCLLSLNIKAQQNSSILERKVTIKVQNQALGKVLNIISETAQFNFSYSSQVVNDKKLVSVHAENRSVKEVLDLLFNGTVSYQQIGNHLVLQKKIVVKKTNQTPLSTIPKKFHYKISGYIRDLNSGNGLNNVSVYEKSTLSNVNSVDFGYYVLEIVSPNSEILLQFSSYDYKDTQVLVQWNNQGIIELHLNLTSNSKESNQDLAFENDSFKTDSVKDLLLIDSIIDTRTKLDDTRIGKWLLNQYTKVLEKNIRDSFFRQWQITFVPPIGTNGKLSSLVNNRFSINTVLGYNGGVRGLELGGFLNVVKNNVKGAQFSGFGNLVQGKVSGLQMAGFFNHNLDQMNGLQAAGFYNYNHENTNGMMLAGFMNLNSKTVNGMQMAGFMNLNQSFKGFQVAGFMNVSKHVEGTQMAGFMNISKTIKGVQFGFINIADSIKGLGIGFLNLYKNGIHQLEINANESKLYGLSFRSGTNSFYSILSLKTQSLDFLNNNNIIAYGYGIGKRIPHNHFLFSNFELSSHQLSYNFETNYLHLMNQLQYHLELKLYKKFSIVGGLSLYHSVDDSTDPKYKDAFKNIGKQFYWNKQNRFEQKIGPGFQFGVRFF